MSLGHVAITQAILGLTTQIANGNPFVVMGPVLYDDNYTPAEGTGIIINGVGVGADSFPVNPGHAYTFSLDINNVFQVLAGTNGEQLYYRTWDNVASAWGSWIEFFYPVIDDWIDLDLSEGNNWVETSSSYRPSYRKDQFGIVRLRGLVKDGNGDAIGRLPLGYRPSQAAVHTTNYADLNNGWRVGAAGRVVSDGYVRINNYQTFQISDYDFVSIGGITFATD